jgi:hypothetical protein
VSLCVFRAPLHPITSSNAFISVIKAIKYLEFDRNGIWKLGTVVFSSIVFSTHLLIIDYKIVGFFCNSGFLKKDIPLLTPVFQL